MYSFKYRTRGQRYPGNKIRVFFYYYPEDENMLETVAKEVLSVCDCAIWLLEGKPETEEEENHLFSDLVKMQMVIVPVTRRLLEELNPAREKYFGFFRKENIPVLPWIQEAGLEEAFWRVFGPVQYLSAFSGNQLGKNFQEKLESVLRIMLHTTTADIIRSFFRYHIFLSYRKKDHSYVPQLMKAVHGTPGLENVAIWYDEFIVPGEDFHEEIKRAIDRCDLFLLQVTPNLTREQNYIETSEYPYAIERNKTVLSYEAEETDREALCARYPGIPACVDMEHISQAVLAQPGIPAAGFEMTSEESWHIGLAYLSGLEVETDRGHGLRLIRNAAENGSTNAMYYLANLFRYGIGVQADLPQACEWLKRMSQILATKAAQTLDEKTTREFLAGSMDLAFLLKECGKYEEAEQQYRKVLAHLSASCTACSEYERIYLELNILNSLARTARITGRKKEADALCCQIIEFIKKLDKKKQDYRINRIAMQACEQLGTTANLEAIAVKRSVFKFALRKRALSNAESWYNMMLTIAKRAYDDLCCQKLFLHPSDISGHIDGDLEFYMMDTNDMLAETIYKDYAVANTKIADIMLEKRDFQNALSALLIAEQILGKLTDMKMENASVRREKALLHRKRADVYCETGDYLSAVTELQEAIREGESLLFQNASERNRMDLAVYCFQLGEAYSLLRRETDAQQFYRKALKLTGQMKAVPDVVNLQEMCRDKIRP